MTEIERYKQAAIKNYNLVTFDGLWYFITPSGDMLGGYEYWCQASDAAQPYFEE